MNVKIFRKTVILTNNCFYGIKKIKLFVNNLKFAEFLSGGGDPRIKIKEGKLYYLVKYCLKNKIPIIGICELNYYIIFKGSIKK